MPVCILQQAGINNKKADQDPFLTDIFVDKGNVILYQAVSDSVHDDAAVTTFDETYVGAHKRKPEPQIIVLNIVKAFLTLFRILFGDGNVLFRNVQIDKGFCKDKKIIPLVL